MSDNVVIANASAGISLSSGLGIAFIVLRLLDIITWSWWWVLAPFWVPWCLLIVVLGAILIVAAISDR